MANVWNNPNWYPNVKNKVRIFLIWILLLSTPTAFCAEYPITPDSTFIGRNWGYPSGTPKTGPTQTGNLDFIFETTFFINNLELPSVGRTFIGYRAPLRFRYRPHEEITLEAGAQIGQNFGDETALDQTDPLLRLVYEPDDDIFIVAGSIISTHPIHNALFDDVNVFLQNLQQGFQLRVDRKRFKNDLWLNWKVRETSIQPEEFDLGSTTQFRIGNLWLDGQILWVHEGGQLNNPDDPIAHIVDHNLSFLIGGSYGFYPTGLVRKIRLGAHYLYSVDIPDVEALEEETSGSGVEVRAELDLKPTNNLTLNLFGAYFKGNEYFARQGDPLYWKDEYMQLGTRLLFMLPAGLRTEIGIDLQYFDDNFAHTEMLYISWGQGFMLKSGLQ